MSNISVSKQSTNGKNKGIAPLGTHFPSIDDFFDKFTSNWPFIRPTFGNMSWRILILIYQTEF